MQNVQNDSRETQMLHFACNVCGITATIVSTQTGRLAWLDHMENHAQKTNYDVWAWTVMQLGLDE